MGGEPTYESLTKPTPKKIWSRWNLKEIEEWLLLSSRCVGICSDCKSHQHLVAKIDNISHRDVWWFPIIMYGWEPTFESLG